MIDNSWDVLAESVHAHRNMNGGIQVHDEFDGNSPHNVTVRGCTTEDNVVGLSHQGGAGAVLWQANYVRCVSPNGAYRVAVDLYRPGPGTWFRDNTLEAESGALLLMAAEGFGSARFAEDAARWRSSDPMIVSRGKTYRTLAEALAAEPLVL